MRALMTAEAVLKELPKWTDHINRLEHIIAFGYESVSGQFQWSISSRGHGMTGSIMDSDIDTETRQRALKILKSKCKSLTVFWPYFIPVGGVMVTPLLDASETGILKCHVPCFQVLFTYRHVRFLCVNTRLLAVTNLLSP